ncbi:hypothetical protein GIB67_009833 [Kingdonia uniflora]|uniref:Exoribonuclease phosphorolytic domain-containing protein n=1 Tax=Kingdonia uniflora TaxID=39325 RepID=A0A7J7LMS1_9MAGN|nr:hypothetical protein GIB67_009833 [Kingdonia uniflora]
MDVDRADNRTPNQLRPLACSRNVLNRAHGSAKWSQGDTIVLAAVYGPKAGTKKNENPEKASIEVIWKQKTGQIGIRHPQPPLSYNRYAMWKEEKEYEMILKRTLQSICLLTVNPNTTTSVILQVVNDDGAVSFWLYSHIDIVILYFVELNHLYTMQLNSKVEILLEHVKIFSDVCFCSFLDNNLTQLLPCAINAACVALVDAGIPLKHLAVAICCGLAESGTVVLDPTKLEEQNMPAFTYLVFPNSVLSVLPEGTLHVDGKPMEYGIITSVTHGVMPVDSYFDCLERGRSACAKLSDFLRRNLQSKDPNNPSKTT